MVNGYPSIHVQSKNVIKYVAMDIKDIGYSLGFYLEEYLENLPQCHNHWKNIWLDARAWKRTSSSLVQAGPGAIKRHSNSIHDFCWDHGPIREVKLFQIVGHVGMSKAGEAKLFKKVWLNFILCPSIWSASPILPSILRHTFVHQRPVSTMKTDLRTKVQG